jgi:hypothetical protein
MAAMKLQPQALLCAVLLLTATTLSNAQAQRPIYKCPTKGGGVVYTHVACDPANPLGTRKPAASSPRHVAPPQDRAKAMRRAQLKPEVREQCEVLEDTMGQQEAELKAKGAAATITDEQPLVLNKKQFRELRC